VGGEWCPSTYVQLFKVFVGSHHFSLMHATLLFVCGSAIAL